MTKLLVRLTFEGGRFQGHTAPVDILAELATLQQLLGRVARYIYLKDKPGRKRLPGGFLDATQLFLANTEANCFTIALHQVVPEPISPTYFSRATHGVLSALAVAETDIRISEDIPDDAFGLLSSLGKRLNPDEAMVFAADDKVAKLDQTVRLRLARVLKRPIERVESVEAEVESLDPTARRGVLVTRRGDRVNLQFEDDEAPMLEEALRGRPVTRLKLRGLMTTHEGVQELRNLEALEVYDDPRAAEIGRLGERLAALKNFSHTDFAPASVTIYEDASRVLTRVLVDEPKLPRPKLFPTPAGGIQAEWVLGPWVVDVEFEPASVGVGATNGVTGEERARLFHISAEPAQQLTSFLKGLT